MRAVLRVLAAGLLATAATGCGDEGLERVGSPGAAETGSTGERRRPNVLLYVVDTLRADAVGAYRRSSSSQGSAAPTAPARAGTPPPRTPHTDALAARGTLFENAHANSSWTRPGVASLLTGLYPPRHGAQQREHRLRADAHTLGTLLGEHGWATALVSTNPNVGAPFGFDQGFDARAELFGRKRPGDVMPEELITPSDEVTASALEWLDRLRARRVESAWCLVLLSIDPHAPHDPPPAFAPPPPAGDARGMDGSIATLRQGRLNSEQKAYARELYAAEVEFNDDSFGALLAGLEERGELENTIVVFGSDHGEEFWEHGKRRGHGASLTEEVTRIPLVFAGPGISAGARVGVDVEQVDVVPTLLALVGLPEERGLDGRALLGPTAGALEPRPLYSVLELGKHRLRAVTEGPWKLVRDTARGREQFFDLRLGEHHPLRTSDSASVETPVDGAVPLEPEAAEALERLRRRLDALEVLDDVPPSLSEELTPELEASLRALGY